MHAKAGESDRAIRVKMVRVFSLIHGKRPNLFFQSPSICSLASAKEERPSDDKK